MLDHDVPAPYTVLSAVRTRFSARFDSIMSRIGVDTDGYWHFTEGDVKWVVRPNGEISGK